MRHSHASKLPHSLSGRRQPQHHRHRHRHRHQHHCYQHQLPPLQPLSSSICRLLSGWLCGEWAWRTDRQPHVEQSVDCEGDHRERAVPDDLLCAHRPRGVVGCPAAHRRRPAAQSPACQRPRAPKPSTNPELLLRDGADRWGKTANRARTPPALQPFRIRSSSPPISRQARCEVIPATVDGQRVKWHHGNIVN